MLFHCELKRNIPPDPMLHLFYLKRICLGNIIIHKHTLHTLDTHYSVNKCPRKFRSSNEIVNENENSPLFSRIFSLKDFREIRSKFSTFRLKSYFFRTNFHQLITAKF